jgi:membrane protein DedA with SNARE-associated domain
MSDLSSLLAEHGYLVISAMAFAEAISLPVPAALAFIAAGAAAASGQLSLSAVATCGVLAMLTADALLYLLGRYTGWALLGFLCRVSMNPETCILKSAESFYKRGKATLLFAKFIPGINTMAPPLAGSMRMRAAQFLRLDLPGVALYVGFYTALGFTFQDVVARLTSGVRTLQHDLEILLLVGLGLYIAYRVLMYRRYAAYNSVPRIPVEELARRIASGRDDILIADVRSHGYYDTGATRILGSVRIEPNNLAEELKTLPKDKDIFLYCT